MSTAPQSLVAFLTAQLPSELRLDLPVDVLAALVIYQLVKRPEQVMVRRRGGDGLVAVEFEVGVEDKGRVIGKHGHLIKALRSLCRSIERSKGQNVILDLVGYDSSEG
jgi:predicted RNA-binding protein YlqC (UPF0109 family)